MAEYTYKDVIIDPEDPRVEIGAEYYYGDRPFFVIKKANTPNSLNFDILIKTNQELTTYPFGFDSGLYSCIIRKKKPSYTERQAKWLADNGIKDGDKVRIIREANDYEDGWGVKWAPVMNEAIGNVGTVCFSTSGIGDSGIDVDVPGVGLFFYPYFVLEKVKQKYVPFDLNNEEDRAKLRGVWVKANGDLDKEQMVCGVCSEYVYLSCQMQGYSAEDFLERFTFLDGTPCGKLEVVEE